MAKTNVPDQRQQLPPKIEARLADLVGMEEFDQGDVAHCRATYWSARDDWHTILIDCYAAAVQRQQTPEATPTPTERRTSGRPDRRVAA